jgi:hypothetical protein
MIFFLVNIGFVNCATLSKKKLNVLFLNVFGIFRYFNVFINKKHFKK